ncbi:MAG: hypothetical protein HY711_09870 [Candidatus Melainabacteria bacterium]|nr:hypothetical protein [Candidatus Melainabacteria bacterium]
MSGAGRPKATDGKGTEQSGVGSGDVTDILLAAVHLERQATVPHAATAYRVGDHSQASKHLGNCQIVGEDHVAPGIKTPADGTLVTENKDGSKVIEFPNSTKATLPSDSSIQKASRAADGSFVLAYKDGTKLTGSSDGAQLTIAYPDGQKLTKRKDGTTVTETPNGNVTTKHLDGTTITENNTLHTKMIDSTDGQTVTTRADGTQVTKHPDGTKTTEWTDGRKLTENTDGSKVYEFQYPDGTKVIDRQNKDGTYVKEYSTGLKETKDKDGTVVTQYPDGRSITRTTDSITIKQETDGTTVTEKPDGTEITKHPDGKVETIAADSTKTTLLPDQTRIVEKPDGSTTTESPDGVKKTHLADGTQITEFPGGLKSTKYQDGSTKTEVPDGTISITDKDGRGYSRAQDSNGRVFEQHWGPKPTDNYSITQDSDGILRGQDSAGNQISKLPDGTLEVQNPATGARYTRTPDGQGGYSENHQGSEWDDTFSLTKGPDGRIETRNKPADQPLREMDNPAVKAERDKLQELAEKKITDPHELAKFHANMARLEDRATAQGLKPQEVAETYKQLGRLLEHKGEEPTTEAERLKLAQEVISQAADPTTIEQGYHSTCNVTTIETRTYTRQPSAAAKLITDVATDGRYKAADGTIVSFDYLSPSLRPHERGERCFASQLFQVTAVNVHYAKENAKTNPPGQIHYEQIREIHPWRADTDDSHKDDSGERLWDWSKRPPQEVTDKDGTPIRVPNLTEDDLVEVNNAITGETTDDVVIAHREDYSGEGKRTTKIDTEDDLTQRLAQLQRDGRLPVIVRVQTGNEPFYTDSGAGAAGGSGGAHVVTITDYQPGPPPKVSVDNQWWKSSDRLGPNAMAVHDLFLSMRSPDNAGTIAALGNDVMTNRENGTSDTFKEFEFLRLKQLAGHLDNDNFEDRLERRMAEAARRWQAQRADGSFNQNEYDKAMSKLNDMTTSSPPDKRLSLLERQHRSGILSDQAYEDALIAAGQAATGKWTKENSDGTADQSERQRTTTKWAQLLSQLSPDRRQRVQLESSRV